MPAFAAKQIASWLYDKKVTSIDEMTNLSLKHRELLKGEYDLGISAPVDEMRSVRVIPKSGYLGIFTTNIYLFMQM